MWTLAEASVECRVMSVATAASADETGCAQERHGAGSGNRVAEQIDLASVVAEAAVVASSAAA